MARIRSLLIGGAIGAAAVYFFDPDLGGARRARLQDQLVSGVRETGRRLDQAVHQVSDSILGAAPPLAPAAPRADDDLTVLGRVERALLAMPGFPRGAVSAEVRDGRLVLHGEVASQEQEREIVAAAAYVGGVAAVESLLHTPRRAGGS